MTDPLHRKFAEHYEASTPAQQAALRQAHVEARCVQAWNKMKKTRSDSFIGITDTTGWIFYAAPCAGVDEDVVAAETKGSRYAKIARGEFDRNTLVKFGNTAAALANSQIQELKKSQLEEIYEPGTICYVPLTRAAYGDCNFDGASHQACHRWAIQRFGLSTASYSSILGWAIQRDASRGYYLRFASGLNRGWAQTASGTFTPRVARADPAGGTSSQQRQPPRAVEPMRKEVRDLPKSWAQFHQAVIARDFVLALNDGEGMFERMTARDEMSTTKLRRFTP